ncbi:MAG TPA: DUF3343 domain-containing protein [Firmicutes bacterium]|jgi:hypothetical protein|nr:DUF3343 domain-containing protein [Bacillota bacterium]
MQLLITFDSTHHALAAESLLLEANLTPDIQPIPRELSASCGLAIAIPQAVRQQALELLRQNAIRYRAIYRVLWQDKNRRERRYEEEV